MLKKVIFLTRPTAARQDAPFRGSAAALGIASFPSRVMSWKGHARTKLAALFNILTVGA
jgi:hypothetical protein